MANEAWLKAWIAEFESRYGTKPPPELEAQMREKMNSVVLPPIPTGPHVKMSGPPRPQCKTKQEALQWHKDRALRRRSRDKY